MRGTEEHKRRFLIVEGALNWLEANPDKHIGGALAKEKAGGKVVSVQSEQAGCFCAIGRIAHDAGFDDDEPGFDAKLRDFLSFANAEPVLVTRINDQHVLMGSKEMALVNLRNYLLW